MSTNSTKKQVRTTIIDNGSVRLDTQRHINGNPYRQYLSGNFKLSVSNESDVQRYRKMVKEIETRIQGYRANGRG